MQNFSLYIIKLFKNKKKNFKCKLKKKFQMQIFISKKKILIIKNISCHFK